MNYTVLITIDGHAIGDVIRLSRRQAKYLILAGILMPHTNRLLDAVTVTGTGEWVRSNGKTFQATLTGTGALTATVEVEFSNDMVGVVKGGINHDGIINLAGNDLASDGFRDDGTWLYKRAKLTELTGTDAMVTVTTDI